MPKRGTDTHPDPEPAGPRMPGPPSPVTSGTTFRPPSPADSDSSLTEYSRSPSPPGNGVPGLPPSRQARKPRSPRRRHPGASRRPAASPFGPSPFLGSGPSNQASSLPGFGGAPSLPHFHFSSSATPVPSSGLAGGSIPPGLPPTGPFGRLPSVAAGGSIPPALPPTGLSGLLRSGAAGGSIPPAWAPKDPLSLWLSSPLGGGSIPLPIDPLGLFRSGPLGGSIPPALPPTGPVSLSLSGAAGGSIPPALPLTGPVGGAPPVTPAAPSAPSAPSAPPAGPTTPPTTPAASSPPSAPSKPSAAPKPLADSTAFVPPTGGPALSGATHQYTITTNVDVPRQEQPVETSTKVPPQDLFYPRNQSVYGECVNRVLFWAYENPQRWATVLACYFQTGERNPRDVAAPFWSFKSGFSGGFRRDWRLLDDYKSRGVSVTPYWLGPEEVVANDLLQAKDGDRVVLEDAMTRWARDPDNEDLCKAVLRATFWRDDWDHNDDWRTMDKILKMPEGKEKGEKMAEAKKESPLFFEACLKDDLCGMVVQTVKKTKPDDDDDEEYEDTYEVRQGGSGLVQIYRGSKISLKRQKLNTAYDYGMMARPAETGPFGKSGRHKGATRGTLRATRTATPAKKESAAADAFMRGLLEDKRRAELYGEGIDPSASYAAPQDTITATANKEPVYVSLYGFSSDTQWAAISYYEKVSRGMICETYDRDPPMEARRYPTAFSALSLRRALTPLERKMSMGYKGGRAWIRVTFDSPAAAERACHVSPHLIQGHWVHAEPYVDGVIPNHDEPIPLRPEERIADTTSAKPSHIPSHKTTQSLGPAFARNMHTQQAQANATLPTSFMPNTASQQESAQRLQPESSSPSTASSATATAPSTATGGMNLRQRVFGQRSSEPSASASRPRQGNTGPFMTHFPDLPRIPLRPAHEAFLPQPTLMERTLGYLEQRGLWPGDVIGNGPPRLENGDFDYANASFYWRFFHWMDSTFGTDLCGMRDD